MAELRNIKWRKFTGSLLERSSLVPFLKSRSLQWWLTIALRKNGYIVLDDLDGLVMEYKGVKFVPDLINYPRMFEAWDRYRIDAVREDDVVLDLGANIGSYTLPVAQKVSKVYAVEPMFFGLLKDNIELNRLNNVEVLSQAVALTSRVKVDCQEYEDEVDSSTFELIVDWYNLQDRLTVLRMDIGGEEWNINLGSIPFLVRLLEIEFHFWNKGPGVSNWLSFKRWLEANEYGYIARWSKHSHWLYLSAEKGWDVKREVQLEDGSFRGRSLELWRGQ